MRSFWAEPFLWIHLAGLGAVPLLLELVWLGLALGDPLLPFGLELALLAAVGSVPPLWMQWARPFDIFSLLLVSLKPGGLTWPQKKILRLLRRPQQRWLAGGVALALGGVLWQLYHLAPLAALRVASLPQWRLLGLAVAALAFCLANVFAQVSLSVVGVLAVREREWEATDPYSPEAIPSTFTVPGWQVDRIWPAGQGTSPPSIPGRK